MEIAKHSPLRTRNWHYLVSLLLVIALAPILRCQHLPLKFDWITVSVAYWLVLAAQSICVAAILSLIGLPREQVLDPLLERYRENPLRVPGVLLYFAILLWAATWLKAFVLTVDTVALLELLNRRKRRALSHTLSAVLVPAAYFFFAFLMVLAYNCVIVSVRFNFAADPALDSIDRWLLHGHTVSDLAHWAVQTFPLQVFRALEFIYFGMFPQIGAGIILLALCDGKMRALRFIGTIVTSYYLALAIFYIWPSQGPYYLCPGHFARFPTSLQAYAIQKTLIAHALARWGHEPLSRISTDYFIGLPCMHIAQPLIVMWFLRRWKRIVIALAVYDLFLLAAVLLLEWHYVADILGGVLVAAIAILLAGDVLPRDRVEATRAEAQTLV